jgi:dienelactone hydrolase
VALAPDYPNFGTYKFDAYAAGYVSATMKGIWNHIRAVDLLESLPEVDRERIGGIGHSLGGHNTLWLGAFDPRLRALVSSCGFNSLRSYAASPYGGGTLKNYAQKRYLPRIETRYGNDPTRVPFDWPEVLAALAPRPVFVNAPLRDENFVVEGVRECVNAAQPVYRLLEAPDALQAVYPDAEHTFPPDIRRQAYEFLERALRRE